MNVILTVLRGALLLCAVLAATGCSALRPNVRLAEPQLIEVPGPVRYVPVPETLTTPTAAPSRPSPGCVDPNAHAVLCNRQLDEWREATQSRLDECNADKAAIRALPIEAGDGR